MPRPNTPGQSVSAVPAFSRRSSIENLEPRRLLASSAVALGSTLNDGIYAIESLPDGSQVVAGIFGGTVDFQPGDGVATLTSRGQSDIFVARYDANRVLTWLGQLGGGGGRFEDEPNYSTVVAGVAEFVNRVGPSLNGAGEYVSAMRVTDTEVIIGGSFQATADFNPGAGESNRKSAGYHDAFVARMSLADGSFVGALSFGGPFDDAVKDLAVTANGDVVATGIFTREADFNPMKAVTMRSVIGRDDIFVARYQADNRLVWVYTAGGDGVDLADRDAGEGIALDSAGNIYVTGSFAGDEADFDPNPDGELIVGAIDRTDGFLLRLSPRGKLDYVRSFGGEEIDGGQRIAIDASDNLFMAGYFSELADLDPTAGAADFLAREEGDSRDDDDDDQGVEEFDAFLGRYSLTGEPVWIRQIGGDDYEMLGRLRADETGVFFSGSFAGRLELYGARDSAVITSVEGDDDFEDDGDRESSFDAFIARYSLNGGFVAAQKVGGNGDDWGTAIPVAPAPLGTIGFAGIFRNTASFALDGAGRNVRSAGLQDAFYMTLFVSTDLM